MYRDPSEFRERFKAYKDGKSVREIYGLPGYRNGKFDDTTKKKIDYYYKLLRNNGFDMMSAIGILGNMMQESSFNPNVVNHLGYHGLLLNSKAIQNAIKNLYGDLSEQSQLRYLSDWTDGATWIRKGPYASDTALYSKSYLRSGYKTPEQAAYEFLKRYERAIVVDPKTKKALRDANGNYIYLDKDKRLGYAKSIYNYLSGRPDGIQELITQVGKTQPEPIIATQDATRVATIPTVQQLAIDYSDRRNAVAAEAERAMWAHNVMEDVKGAYQVPIWESPSLPALTPVEYDVTPLKTYAGGKVSNEPVITQGRAGSRLDKLDRMMDPDEDDGVATRVAKKIGKGITSIAQDAKKIFGLETVDRFATRTQRPEDYVDAAFLTVGNAIISKIMKSSSKTFIKLFVMSFDDMDARAIGKYFFLEHPELMTQPQEAWYGELAKKSDSYFRLAIDHRVKMFDREGRPLSPESIAALISPDIKIAPIKGSRYGGIYSAPDNTMLVNSDLVKDPRTAAKVYNHERAHAMQTAFENEVGLPYPIRYGTEMEALFPFTAEQKIKRPGVHIGKEIDASLHEVKSLRSYDTNQLGRALDVDFENMSDEEFKQYANNGYFKDIMQNILNGLQAQKKFIGKLKNGKLPGYSKGKDDEDEFGVNVGTVVGAAISQKKARSRTESNKKVDEQIANKQGYGWSGYMRTPIHTASQAKEQINPAWRFGNAVGVGEGKLFGIVDKSDATKDDIAFWNRHIGYPRDFESMPVTGIRFAGDYNPDGSLRLPDAEYTGLSKTAKDFIRRGVENGDLKVDKNKWTVIDESRSRYGKNTSHMGSYSVRENGNSGIYDVFDTYDFPWYSGIFNRDEGKQIEVRDTIWGPNARPLYYDPNLKSYRDGKISIKPSKRGTFTAAAKKHGASVREFESRVLKNPEKYSKAMVKKARFSRNARSWKH